jgi:hypothetical protein
MDCLNNILSFGHAFKIEMKENALLICVVFFYLDAFAILKEDSM